MASPEPFRAYRAVQATYDVRMARLLERTAKAIRARIAKLPVGVGGEVRKAQLTLVLEQIDKVLRSVYGGPMLDTIQAGRKAGAVAAESAAETLTAVAYAALPEAVAETLTRGLRASALSGIESAFARVPRELSTRVYRNSTLAIKQVHELIDQGLASGLSARELAASVYRHISPTTPGGASYAAMRLARTEINNAFHERQIIAGERPGVLGCKWNLSGSHKVPDECNLFAQRDSHDLGRGVYPVGLVPDRPHPQCFCFLTYVTMSPEQFASALDAGQFDDELDRRTKANIERLGGVVPAPPPKVQKADPLTDREAMDSVPKGLFKPKTLTPAQRKQFEHYEGSGFREINPFLRGGAVVEDVSDERTQRSVDVMDSAFQGSELPKDIEAWRGMYTSRNLFGDNYDNDLTGFSWKELGYSSTTANEGVARDFMVLTSENPKYKGQNTKIRVFVPGGVEAVQISSFTEGSKVNGPQAEVLLQRGLTWRIIKDHGMHPDGYRLLDAEVIR